MEILKFIILIGCFIFPVSSFAATDGTLGASSTGTTNLSVTIPKLIRARSFADFSLGSYSGAGDLNGNDDLNISINYIPGTYRVTATGSGAASAFTITNGSSTIAYNAYYNDATGTAGRVALTSGTAVTGQVGAVRPLSTATLNANLSIEFLAANLLNADAANYTGSITLVFQPE